MARTKKFISSLSVVDIITRYQRPPAQYNAHNRAVPNPTASELWFVYTILKLNADYITGISLISKEKLMELTQIADKHKLQACISILCSLGVLYYLKGGLFYKDSAIKEGKTFANKYIFPKEDWDYPLDPDDYNAYILNPLDFLQKKNKAPEKKVEDRAQNIFNANGEVQDHKYFTSLLTTELAELKSSKKISPHDLKNIRQFVDYLKQNQENYRNRYNEGKEYWKLEKEEVDWITRSEF